MATAFFIVFFGPILFVWAIISLFVVVLNKNKENCKGFLLLYFIFTYVFSILCGMTCQAELNWLPYGLKSYLDFIEAFLFVFIISNIPSLIMLAIYKEKFPKGPTS